MLLLVIIWYIDLEFIAHCIFQVEVGGGKRVSASEQPGGVAFCTDLLAKKFVVSYELKLCLNI